MLLDKIIKLQPIKNDENNIIEINDTTLHNIKINLELYKKIESSYEDLKYIEKIEIKNDKIVKCINLMKKYKPKLNEKIIMVNLKKINDLWKKDENYLCDDYEKIINKNKYLWSRLDLIEENINEPPVIIYDEDKDLISFINGRHRFSNLRDLGCEEIPVIIIDKITFNKIEKL